LSDGNPVLNLDRVDVLVGADIEVTVRLYEPSLPLFELMYSMSCEPLTCCSIGAATDCATTSAFAPAKLVVTVT
jgi:hypothetical protein